MNAKTVLSKIVSLLSKEEEVELTYARLKDGTVVESSTFDVGEALFVVGEDGEKTPAPDGEHELTLTDSEGNEVLFKVISKDGVIVERENVELEEEVSEEAVEEMVAGLIDALTPDAVSTEEAADIAEKVLEALEDKIEILKRAQKLEVEIESVEGDLPSTGDGVPADIEQDGPSIEESIDELVVKLGYRIDELEKKIAKMEEVDEEVVDEDADIEEDLEDEEDELPKLDGAPVEAAKKFSTLKTKQNNNKHLTAQERVWLKMYK
jgi:hypothetical protein